MSDIKVNNSGGIGFLPLLTIMFVVLKLTGSISWSWWWVLLPVWGGFVFFGSLFMIAFLIILIADNLGYRR